MPRKKNAPAADSQFDLAESSEVKTYKHPAKRKNIPAVGLEAQGVIPKVPPIRFSYNPHLPPVLRSATNAHETDRLPELLKTARQRALTEDEARLLADALRRHEPWLEWSGKREKPWFVVDPVAIHMHERVSTQAMLRVLAREDVQRSLFADPVREYSKAVQFYKHDDDWSNRMILGDSLQVMASLSRREDLAGKVQMIYIDPPYGINFKSNFQPQLGQRDVKDREQDLTREPEMVRAYRDTWTLKVHSYLAYLRDRLTLAKELLAPSGSIFVQISDENLHRVRCLMDEVFEPRNFSSLICFKSTTGQADSGLATVCDFILWYAKDIDRMKFRRIYGEKKIVPAEFSAVDFPDGHRRRLFAEEKAGASPLSDGYRLFDLDNLVSQGFRTNTSIPFTFEGKTYDPGKDQNWKTSIEGLHRLANAERLGVSGVTLRYVRFGEDFPVTPINNIWDDTSTGSFTEQKVYVVQSSVKAVARCLLMTTDPGDLVLDPTCGSGTTAYVAEHWGRRWITCDSSRVALAIARQRLMTARFPYFKLRALDAEDIKRNPQGTWLKNGGDTPMTLQCKTVPHITLKSIARNTSLDSIFTKYEPVLTDKLRKLNSALKSITPELRSKLAARLEQKQQAEGKRAVTEADRRRWNLPQTAWQAWEVPFDFDNDWPKPLRDALIGYRATWQEKRNEVISCIEASAEVAELVDKPDEAKNVVRVCGPFTTEGVIALEESLDASIDGVQDELEIAQEAGDIAVANAEAHLDRILRLLKASGVDFPGNKNQKFTRLDPITGAALLHAEGEWMNGDKRERRVAVSIGPEVGNITTKQVEDAVRAANRRGYDDVVFAGFGFDAAAQSTIEESSHPNLRVHMALIRPDVAMGELLKTQPGSQIFTVFSAPRVSGPTRQRDGQYVVEVEGMDIYDPVNNTLHPTDKERIAAWFLDSDYDGRTFCICQAFFPDKSKWEKLAKALGASGAVDEASFESLSGHRSLPFPRPPRLRAGESWRIAVKVMDPRGNEGLRVMEIV